MIFLEVLTHYRSYHMEPAYGNQNNDLQGKSIDWFLYESNFAL